MQPGNGVGNITLTGTIIVIRTTTVIAIPIAADLGEPTVLRAAIRQPSVLCCRFETVPVWALVPSRRSLCARVGSCHSDGRLTYRSEESAFRQSHPLDLEFRFSLGVSVQIVERESFRLSFWFADDPPRMRRARAALLRPSAFSSPVPHGCAVRYIHPPAPECIVISAAIPKAERGFAQR